MLKKLFFILLLFNAVTTVAQDSTALRFTNRTLVAAKDQMPFWLTANRNGEVAENASFLNLTEAVFYNSGRFLPGEELGYFLGSHLIVGVGDKNYFRGNQAFSGLTYKNWELKAGWFSNPVNYGGLSSTNGDIHWSNNIRPIPRIRLSADYLRFSFFPSWMEVRGLYEEAWLNDANRFVQKARLHHKNVLFRFALSESISLVAGLDHYVQWGGEHPTLGQLPQGVDDYFRYILGLPGSDEFTKSDQSLMAGNQLGKYIVKINRQFESGELEVYLNHPFTDRMDWSNYKDNLLGIFYRRETPAFITAILYEFMYTKFQRAVRTDDGGYTVPGGGSEPYFMHGTYRSGLSYNNRMFVTPFAIPLTIADGVNYGTGNNRIVLHHLGAGGYLSSRLSWKGLFSFSANYGTFASNYDKVKPDFFDAPRKQVSLLGQINYGFKSSRWQAGLTLAFDKGSLLSDNAGVEFSLTYRISGSSE